MEKQNDEVQAQEQSLNPTEGNKSFLATWLMSYFVGSLGIDRFYLGYIFTGILKLITLGGFGIWTLIDLIWTAFGKRKDKKGYLLQGYSKDHRVIRIVTIVLLLINISYLLLVVFILVPGAQTKIQNSLRTDDINGIQRTIKLYETTVSALLPVNITSGPSKVVNFCSTTCQNGETNINLVYYKPSTVSLQEYAYGLSVTNDHTVYVVNNAECNASNTSLGSTKVHYVSVLYALKSSSGTKPVCSTINSITYHDVDAFPYCGQVPTAGMSTAAYQYLVAAINLNEARQPISNAIKANGGSSTQVVIQDQLTADQQFLDQITKIKYPANIEPDALAQQNAIKQYDQFITLEDQDYNSEPASLNGELITAGSDRSAASNILREDLNLPESTCSFNEP